MPFWRPSDNLDYTCMLACMQQRTAPGLRMCHAHRIPSTARRMSAHLGCACFPPYCAQAGSLEPKALPVHLSHAHAASMGSRPTPMALSSSVLNERRNLFLFTCRPGRLPAPTFPCSICSSNLSCTSLIKLPPAESVKEARRVGAPAHPVCWGEGGPLEMAALLQVTRSARHAA